MVRLRNNVMVAALVFGAGLLLVPGAIRAQDTDGDAMPDSYENTYGCLQPNTVDADVDYDSDGMTSLSEYLFSLLLDPCALDTDDDGLNDGDEINLHGTNPLNWDSDDDFLPDGYEVTNSSGHPVGQNLNPLNPNDGGLDFDGDQNPNGHEYWNPTDPWAKDPVPDPFANPACYYWAEGDGDGVIGPGDVSIIKQMVATGALTYQNVLPRGVFDTQDVDKDGTPGPGDIAFIQDMCAGIDRPSGYPSSPASLLLFGAPGEELAVGDMGYVMVAVFNASLTVPSSGGFAVVFSIDPASTGAAVFMGGEGKDLGQAFDNRYDVSGFSGLGGLAIVFLKATGPGTILVNAKLPACGTGTTGRWAPEVNLAVPAVITVH